MSTTPTTFGRFLLHDTGNRIYVWGMLIASLLLWVVFKLLYPNPNIIFDSYHYIKAAASGATVNAWPMGYSWFIRGVGVFSHSANVLLLVQYMLLQLSLIFLLASVRYIFQPGKWASVLCCFFLLFNPIFLFSGNLILSDTLFTAFSIAWVTQLCWLLYRPKSYMIYTHALILLAAFTVRYNALYYPVIATLALLQSRLTTVKKLTGIALHLLLLFAFITWNNNQMKATEGIKQFSPFGGWKLASNALYMYEHVYQQSDTLLPPQLQALDRRVRKYFNRPHQPANMLVDDPTWGSYYMYMYPSPLITYMHSLYGPDKYPFDFRNFSRMGPVYQQYGAWLIQKHPLAFTQYFLWPNVQRYIAPPQEVYVDSTNPFHLRKNGLSAYAIQWFHLSTLYAKPSLIQFRTQLFGFYPAITALIHYYFLLVSILLLTLKKNIAIAGEHYRIALLAMALWVCDFGFNVLAAGVVMRYQLCIITIAFLFSVLFTRYLLLYKPDKQPASNWKPETPPAHYQQ